MKHEECFTRKKKIMDIQYLDSGKMQGHKLILRVKIIVKIEKYLYLVQASHRSKSQGKQLYLK